jgi:hypothetical protein
MRPEMTQKSIQNILIWNQLNSLTVVIDGIRNTANTDEENWRAKTISICEQFKDEKFELIVYDTNVGITDHVNRVHKRILPVKPNAIWVEEDFELKLEQYSNFVERYRPKAGPFLMAGNSQGNHLEIEHPLRTFFPPYWGQVLSIELTEQIEKLRIDKRIDPNVSREFISNYSKKIGFPKKYLLDKQISYWDQYFNWAIYSPHRWDALATYVLWSHHIPTLVPPFNLVDDLAESDSRGMNKRHENQNPSLHQLQIRNIEDLVFCENCEHRKSRVSRNLHELIRNGLAFRGRILNEKLNRKR